MAVGHSVFRGGVDNNKQRVAVQLGVDMFVVLAEKRQVVAAVVCLSGVFPCWETVRRSIRARPLVEPIASPSGRIWRVIIMRSYCLILSNTALIVVNLFGHIRLRI